MNEARDRRQFLRNLSSSTTRVYWISTKLARLNRQNPNGPMDLFNACSVLICITKNNFIPRALKQKKKKPWRCYLNIKLTGLRKEVKVKKTEGRNVQGTLILPT